MGNIPITLKRASQTRGVRGSFPPFDLLSIAAPMADQRDLILGEFARTLDERYRLSLRRNC